MWRRYDRRYRKHVCLRYRMQTQRDVKCQTEEDSDAPAASSSPSSPSIAPLSAELQERVPAMYRNPSSKIYCNFPLNREQSLCQDTTSVCTGVALESPRLSLRARAWSMHEPVRARRACAHAFDYWSGSVLSPTHTRACVAQAFWFASPVYMSAYGTLLHPPPPFLCKSMHYECHLF